MSGFAFAQPAAPAATNLIRPTAQAARIDVSEAPIIDGDLSDPAWAKATIIDKFTQKQPNPGTEPTERTVLRIMYDENNLYFGVYNYDSQPDAIVVRSMQRDGPLYTSDSFVIQLDPGQTRRNAYSFEVGASGGRTDELELNNTQELTQWNTIWAARVRRVADGWTAEVAIPFRDLSFNAAQAEWGFDFSRRIRHKNEREYWSGFNPTLAFTDISQNGNLTGITDINRGLGLDVQVYGALRLKRDWQIPSDRNSLSITEGGNAFYKITPGLDGNGHRQSGFFRRAARRPAGQHHPILALHAGNAGLFPARRRDLRIRRTQFYAQLQRQELQQWQTVFLAQYRPCSRRTGNDPGRRKIVGRI